MSNIRADKGNDAIISLHMNAVNFNIASTAHQDLGDQKIISPQSIAQRRDDSFYKNR